MATDDDTLDPLDLLQLRAEHLSDWWARVAAGDGLARAIGYAVATNRLGDVRARLAGREPQGPSATDSAISSRSWIGRVMVACGGIAAGEPSALVDLATLYSGELCSDPLSALT